MISQYRVTYDSNNETFIVHQEISELPDMEFRMHKWGLHVFYPEEINNLALMNTVKDNMKAFTKHDFEEVKAARKLYTKLFYRSNADFKWLINNNQIKNCGVLVRNIDTTQEIWRKYSNALKGKTV